MTKYSCYEYEIKRDHGERRDYYTNLNDAYEPDKWSYIVKSWNDYYGCDDNVESDEWFDTEEQAEQAAKDHIDRWENGEQ